MMKRITLLLAVLAFTIKLTAQTQYEKEMSKAFQFWGKNNTEAVQLFERISNAEKSNWLPPYYAATLLILEGFSIKDEAQLTAHLNRAQKFLDTAKERSKGNPEIIINQALLNLVYISFDGQKYGMTLSGKNMELYAKALKIAPNNPRVVLAKAQWDMGSAKFFGQPTMPFCKEIKRSITLFKSEVKKGNFHPFGGIERAQAELKKECGS